MLENTKLEEQVCQPVLAYCGIGAEVNLNTNLSKFKNLNFKNIHGAFLYEIKISRFASEVFYSKSNSYFAYLVQVYMESDDFYEKPFQDINIFFEKDFEDLIEYSIILPRLFKTHHRYVFDMERCTVCNFKQFGENIELWKKSNGLS
jgi:hypothetical protein